MKSLIISERTNLKIAISLVILGIIAYSLGMITKNFGWTGIGIGINAIQLFHMALISWEIILVSDTTF